MAREDTTEFIAMKGAGYYSKATIGAKHVMDNAAELVLGAVDRMAPADDRTTKPVIQVAVRFIQALLFRFLRGSVRF